MGSSLEGLGLCCDFVECERARARVLCVNGEPIDGAFFPFALGSLHCSALKHC